MPRAASLTVLCLGLAMAASATAQPVRQDTTHTPVVASSSPADPWLGRDKAMHAAASFGLAMGGQLVLTEGAGLDADRALPISAGTTLALGVMKELTDRRRDHHPLFSWRDLVADALGIGLAALVVSL
ncbi:MAG: hypothetical protein AAF170_12365 [Bacteroidota bacterium]